VNNIIPKYRVGFDRFIELEWAKFALEIASLPDSNEEKIRALKARLSTLISGEESVRKTANVLTRLWVEPNSAVKPLAKKAIILSPDLLNDEQVVLHYGIALALFPLFRDTCIQVGRLIQLQGLFHRQEVRQRVMEHYSNQGTIPRSVDRILQTLNNWGITAKGDKTKYYVNRKVIKKQSLQLWLLEAAVYSAPEHRILLNDIFRLPDLFPFDFNGESRNALTLSSGLRIERDGTNHEYIVSSLEQ
jgi:hypothetical protein